MFTLLIVLYAFSVAADEIKCGEVPLIADESLKAEIEGKARLLSRYLGDAALSGQIETSRKDIFAKYPNAQKARADAALEYQMCEYLKQDKTLSPLEKFKMLRDMKGAFLLQKQSEIEEGYKSSNAAERAVAIRNAFEAMLIFGVRLEPDLSLVSEGQKNIYLGNLTMCEQQISKPIRNYSRETGKFSEMEDPNTRSGYLQGQVSGQSIRFGGYGIYSGDLINTGKDWIFTGLVTCLNHKYKGVLQLR
jgi:hypothetical protein